MEKDPAVGFLYFSFDNGGMVKNFEPAWNDYDLLFTQYTTLLYTDIGEAYPYLVTGVLLNRFHVAAAVDTVHDFASISFETAQGMTYANALDVIGYDWKRYDFENNVYTMRPWISYLIRDPQGYYFKLRFVGFYNSDGLKGYPTIEFQRL